MKKEFTFNKELDFPLTKRFMKELDARDIELWKAEPIDAELGRSLVGDSDETDDDDCAKFEEVVMDGLVDKYTEEYAGDSIFITVNASSGWFATLYKYDCGTTGDYLINTHYEKLIDNDIIKLTDNWYLIEGEYYE